MNTQTTDDDKPTDDYAEAAERQPKKTGYSHMGTPPPEISELVRAEDRLSFAYFEHCTIGRDDNAITATDSTGVTHIPAATLSVLMLGPGTRVTHQAMTVIGENGATVIWVGERGIRMYAFGKPLTHSSVLLQRQAALVSNTRKRLNVARQMYQMRFPGEDVSGLLRRMVKDIRVLLGESSSDGVRGAEDHVGLWDERLGEVSAGKSYADDEWGYEEW